MIEPWPADTSGMETSPIIAAYSASQRVLGFSNRTVSRRIWSLTSWERHLTDHHATLATATVTHLETFLSR